MNKLKKISILAILAITSTLMQAFNIKGARFIRAAGMQATYGNENTGDEVGCGYKKQPDLKRISDISKSGYDVTNDTVGIGDPYVGKVKELVMLLSDGQSLRSKEKVPAIPAGLTLVGAYYGCGKNIDVTNIVEAIINSGDSSATASNKTFGIDPDPSQTKRLMLTYPGNLSSVIPEGGKIAETVIRQSAAVKLTKATYGSGYEDTQCISSYTEQTDLQRVVGLSTDQNPKTGKTWTIENNTLFDPAVDPAPNIKKQLFILMPDGTSLAVDEGSSIPKPLETLPLSAFYGCGTRKDVTDAVKKIMFTNSSDPVSPMTFKIDLAPGTSKTLILTFNDGTTKTINEKQTINSAPSTGNLYYTGPAITSAADAAQAQADAQAAAQAQADEAKAQADAQAAAQAQADEAKALADAQAAADAQTAADAQAALEAAQAVDRAAAQAALDAANAAAAESKAAAAESKAIVSEIGSAKTEVQKGQAYVKAAQIKVNAANAKVAAINKKKAYAAKAKDLANAKHALSLAQSVQTKAKALLKAYQALNSAKSQKPKAAPTAVLKQKASDAIKAEKAYKAALAQK